MGWTSHREACDWAGFIPACRTGTNTDCLKQVTLFVHLHWPVTPVLAGKSLLCCGLRKGWRRHRAIQARRKEALRKLEEWGSPLKRTLGWTAYPSSNPFLSCFPGTQYFLQARLVAEASTGLAAVTVTKALHTHKWVMTGLCCLQWLKQLALEAIPKPWGSNYQVDRYCRMASLVGWTRWMLRA